MNRIYIVVGGGLIQSINATELVEVVVYDQDYQDGTSNSLEDELNNLAPWTPAVVSKEELDADINEAKKEVTEFFKE